MTDPVTDAGGLEPDDFEIGEDVTDQFEPSKQAGGLAAARAALFATVRSDDMASMGIIDDLDGFAIALSAFERAVAANTAFGLRRHLESVEHDLDVAAAATAEANARIEVQQPLFDAAMDLWRADEAAQGMTQNAKEGQACYDAAIRNLLAMAAALGSE